MVIRKSLAAPLELIAQLQVDPLCHSMYPRMFGYFERDQEHLAIREQALNDGILIAVAAGRGWYSQGIDGQKIVLQRGQLLIVPPHECHRYGSSGEDPWTIYWSHIQGTEMSEICQALNQDQPEQAWHHQVGELNIPLWRQCLEIYQAAISLHQVRQASALLRQILARGAAHEHQEKRPFAEVLYFMEENIDADLQLSDLARCAGLSKHHFSRQFQIQYGSPPHRYFLALKMNRAAQDLDTAQNSIAEIAQRYGYEDQFYFSRLFKKITGYSPRAYQALDKG